MVYNKYIMKSRSIYYIIKYYLYYIILNFGKPIAMLSTYFKLVSCLDYSLTLKMEAIYSSETSVHVQLPAGSYIPKDRIIHNHRIIT
jgi:hypothetical protein